MSTSSATFGPRTAQALAIAGSAFLSGSIISISTVSAPALIVPGAFYFPNQVAQQWKALYTRGASTMPPLAILSSSAYFYLAYKLSNWSTGMTRKYIVAGLLTIGIVPYTLLVMAKTNEKLSAKAVDVPTEKSEVADGPEVKDLVESWTTMNFVRGVLPLAGTIFGLHATFF
ncbi:hypothetical protein PM082_000722 [Marasmius tenuissimus]|nr:hypothetical protein PM082_000722 [Marasmius tenuissimus]